jgi:hypothetical protein
VQPNPDRLIPLTAARDELEAGIWRDILERDGIAVHVQSTDPMSTFGVPPAPGSLRLFVQPADERRARWLLGERIRTV